MILLDGNEIKSVRIIDIDPEDNREVRIRINEIRTAKKDTSICYIIDI